MNRAHIQTGLSRRRRSRSDDPAVQFKSPSANAQHENAQVAKPKEKPAAAAFSPIQIVGVVLAAALAALTGLSLHVLSNIGADIRELRADSLSLRADTQSLRADTQSLRADTKSLRADSQSLRGDIQILRTETQSLRSDTQSLRSDTQVLRAESQSLRTDTEILRTESQSLRAKMESNHQEVLHLVNGIKVELAALRAKVDGGAKR